MRGVDATVKLATAAPDGVNRSSGSAVRFPTTVMVVSPATRSSWSPIAPRVYAGIWGRWLSWASLRRGSDSRQPLVLVGPKHLGPQHGLVQAELTVQLGHRGRVGLHVDHRVNALGMLGDLVCRLLLEKKNDLVDTFAVLADDVEEGLQ